MQVDQFAQSVASHIVQAGDSVKLLQEADEQARINLVLDHVQQVVAKHREMSRQLMNDPEKKEQFCRFLLEACL